MENGVKICAFMVLYKPHNLLPIHYYILLITYQKSPTLSVIVLNGQFTLNYDCPYGQVMSYDMLRIVMIGLN